MARGASGRNGNDESGDAVISDPQYPVGARVRWQERSAVVTRQDFIQYPDEPYRFLGYELTFPDGSFSGWHPEDELTKDEVHQ